MNEFYPMRRWNAEVQFRNRSQLNDRSPGKYGHNEHAYCQHHGQCTNVEHYAFRDVHFIGKSSGSVSYSCCPWGFNPDALYPDDNCTLGSGLTHRACGKPAGS